MEQETRNTILTETQAPEETGDRRKTLGIALGAGSARGFAHLGFLHELEESGVPIDYLAGSSMGSVVGGIYACGSDLDTLCKIVPLLREKDYFDVVFPTHGGFVRGDRFRKLIQLFTKHYEFSQTHIPFACTAVDLINGELVVIDEGPLDDAIRASIAIPGVIEPHTWRGRVLVDGGVILRVPSRVARAMGADVVVGIDVGYRGETLESLPTSLMEYLFVATDIMSWTAAQYQESEADLLVVPKVRDCDPNSLRDFEALVDAGRLAAQDALPKIRALLGLEAPLGVDAAKAVNAGKTTLRIKDSDPTTPALD